MTIQDAISVVDRLRVNAIEFGSKVRMLDELDRRVYDEILLTHHIPDLPEFDGYDEDTPGDTELLVPAPYDSMYRWWLEMQIDIVNAEMAKYNNAAALFNTAYYDYQSYVNRKFMPHSKVPNVRFIHKWKRWHDHVLP